MHRFYMKETFPCGAREAFERAMYDFDEYVKFMPNVASIEVLERTNLPNGLEKIVVQVTAKAMLPEMARKIGGMNDMQWKEHYTVNVEKMTVDWKIETPVFTEYIDCGGTSCMRGAGNMSEMIIDGDFEMSPPPIRGVPPAVVQATIRAMEPFITKMVMLNMKKYFSNIKKDIEKKKRK